MNGQTILLLAIFVPVLGGIYSSPCGGNFSSSEKPSGTYFCISIVRDGSNGASAYS